MSNNYLKEVRGLFLISKAKLAKIANLSPLTISRIEKGYRCREVTKQKIVYALERYVFHRRLGINRRQLSYTMYIPERRTVKDRRKSVNGIKTRTIIYKMIF
jgi:DNA-binding XRE family transcriptional regulator